ncbi:hypothetical protein Dimus_011357, partial [Dionaea muscipula]
GAITDVFLRSSDFVTDAQGMASLHSQLSLLHPLQDLYTMLRLLPRRHLPCSGRENLKKLFAAWYERRQMKRIYSSNSPLLEGILALYLGFEWIQPSMTTAGEHRNGKRRTRASESRVLEESAAIRIDDDNSPDSKRVRAGKN